MAAQTGQKVFGAGRFYGINNVANATPNQGIVVQDVGVTFKRDIKRLHGQNQLAVDVAAGMMTVTGKATLGGIAARFFNALMIGGTLSTGQQPNIVNEVLASAAGPCSGCPRSSGH